MKEGGWGIRINGNVQEETDFPISPIQDVSKWIVMVWIECHVNVYDLLAKFQNTSML